MKRFLCLFLALILVGVCALCSCNDPTTSTSKPEESSTAPESSEPQGFVPHLEDRDFSDKELRVLTVAENQAFSKEQFNAVELNDEPVNDACFDRDQRLKEEYGFSITSEYIEAFDPFLERVRNDTAAGTVNYDVCATGVITLAILAADNKFVDLNAIENSNLKLTEDWWDTALIEDSTIMNQLYFVTGDILMLDDEQTNCIFYNKNIVETAHIDDPAQLVYDGTWTLDAFYTMCKAAAMPGGDGAMDVTTDDTWGMVCDSFDTYSLVLGCDCPQVSKNSEDIPVLAMGNEQNVNAFLKTHEIMVDKSCVAFTEQYYRWNAPEAPTVKDQFYSGRSLFLINKVTAVNSDKMRTAEIRYGILPMPKYDAVQEDYATTINPYHFMCLSIIKENQDLDFVTFALEALAYSSKQIVTPEYYERTLKNKRFPENDSPEMLDILFSNRLLDISVVYNWDDCIQYYNQLNGQVDPIVASFLEMKEDSFNLAVEKTLDEFKKRSN